MAQAKVTVLQAIVERGNNAETSVVKLLEKS